MGSENKSSKSKPANNNNNKKRKHYLPHNRPVKRGAYPLRPGVEGFFITCDGGREQQASHEAIDVIDSFYEELVEGTESTAAQAKLPTKPMNKITKFASDSDEDGDDDAKDDHPKDNEEEQTKEEKGEDAVAGPNASVELQDQIKEGVSSENQTQGNKEESESHENQEAQAVEPPVKKHCIGADAPISGNLPKTVEKKSVDKLIEEELAELGDKSKRRFSKLDSGCNGVVFVQMRKREGDPSPKDIVQHMMTSLASSRKHVSRFLLRVLPVEVSCYTSEEEIKRAIKPVIDKHFPVESEVPRKFAVLYDARANTGIDRTKTIDTVAKCVPGPHKVDLSNPDINIVVQIVKTVCLIGVVEKYKELAKYNIRQLTSSKP